ncbi:haloacid dehalogenase [Methanothermobacter tenebrarum]|jgi:translin|uniref:Haloacid dehalogenase n=1 Tax=Methanothermobacter tenebrarum TaxID=680118 RepID=A0ABM7YCL3_9EURY|nr:haloacid dehalogenase [Methanothermobacter tenebrarum]BDH78955.1 haloacid dehalogenase [Methanothermobacter tenebrarum]HOQ20505.1 haloacid dehalogenase [Methanothermobacter sp.]
MKDIIGEIKKVLDEKDELREEALKITRKIIRLCGECIRAIHRNELNLAGEKLNKAGKLVEDLGRMLMGHPDLYYAGYVKSAHQEYVEALLFYNYVNDLEFPLPQEVGVPESQYLLGLGDFIGELRRYFLENLVKGDLEGAEKVCRSIKDFYDELSILEYPRSLVNIKHKQDNARYILERTLEDLIRAKGKID